MATKSPSNLATTCDFAVPHKNSLDALEDLVAHDRADGAGSGFTDSGMTWLENARRAVARRIEARHEQGYARSGVTC